MSETNWREIADALAKAIEAAYQSGGELTPAAGHALFAYHRAGLWGQAVAGQQDGHFCDAGCDHALDAFFESLPAPTSSGGP